MPVVMRAPPFVMSTALLATRPPPVVRSAIGTFAEFMRSNLKSEEDKVLCFNFLESLDATPDEKSDCIDILNKWITHHIFAGTYTFQPTSTAHLTSRSLTTAQIMENILVAIAGIEECNKTIDKHDSDRDTDSEDDGAS